MPTPTQTRNITPWVERRRDGKKLIQKRNSNVLRGCGACVLIPQQNAHSGLWEGRQPQCGERTPVKWIRGSRVLDRQGECPLPGDGVEAVGPCPHLESASDGEDGC